jgi:lipopolysaccharide transport protein LptA
MFKIILLCFILIINKSNATELQNNFNSPIKIQSNEILIKRNKNLITFSGKVEVQQDTLNMFANKMIVKYKINQNNDTEIQNIKLYRNVILKNKNITVRGDKGNYEVNNNLITLEDNIIMNEDDAVIFGKKMTYNTITEETNIFGSDENENNSKKERITIILDDINDLKDRYDK